MKKTRKTVSVLLSLIMVIGIMSVAFVSAEAATVVKDYTVTSLTEEQAFEANLKVGESVTVKFKENISAGTLRIRNINYLFLKEYWDLISIDGDRERSVWADNIKLYGPETYTITALKQGRAILHLTMSYYLTKPGANDKMQTVSEGEVRLAVILNIGGSGGSGGTTTPSAAAPTNVTMYNHDTGLHVDWYKAANASRYIVYYRPSWSSSWSSTTTSNTYCNLTGLTPGTLYYVQVRSVNSSGVNGGISGATSFTHVRGTKLNSTAYNSNGTVTVGWSSAPGANGYAVAKKRSTDKNYTYYYVSGTSFTDKNVAGGALYYYQIRPYYSNGKSAAYAEWSNSKTITTLFKPTITNMNINASRLNINWNAIKGASSYKVAFKRSTDSAWNYRTTTSRYYNVANPTPNALYYVQVCPLNGSLAGSWSDVKSISLATLAKPTLSGNANGSRNYLSWNSVSGAKSYQIAKKTTQQSSYTYITTSSTSYNDYSFTDGKTYTYQVRAYNGSTYGPWSNVATLKPPVDKPYIYLAESYSDRIQAEWNEVEGAAYYRVAYRKSTESSWSYTTVYDTEFDLYYPSSNSKYYVSVYAVGENGTKSDWTDDVPIYT